MFKDVYAEFLSLIEQSSGRSLNDLGFRPPASEKELADMEAALRGDSDEDEWNEKVGPEGLADLKTMLRLANGHTTKLALLNGPLLSAEEVAREYRDLLEYASDDDSPGYNDDETLQAVNMHAFWIPFASYPAEVTYLVDFVPGPAGRRGQVVVSYGFEDTITICSSLTELFSLASKGLREKVIKIGPIEDYEQEYDVLTADGEQADIIEVLRKLRGD